MGKEANKKKKNDIAWEKIFEKHNILEALQKDKLFKIKSSEINKVREARLMTKFDKEIDLPKIFKKNNLSILPIGRGEYVLGKFKTYFEIKSKDSAGYVSELEIGETVCTGDQFRDALSLPSSAFSLNESGKDDIKITTTGKGHGLGMSLWTAEQMAEEGKDCEEILSFFFEGTELRKDIQETEIF